jgi:hypothetical protein
MLSPDEIDELDDVITRLTALEANDSLVDPLVDTLQDDLSQMTLSTAGSRIRWPSGPYYPDDKPALSLVTRDNDEVDLDKDTSQLLRLLVSTPNFQESLKDRTFVGNFIKGVKRFSGVDLTKVLPKINWGVLVDEVKEELQADYDAVSATHSVIYVDGKPYRQRLFSLPLSSINPDGTINFPVRPSDVTLNKNDVAASWLARWTNPNTNEVNYLRFTLAEPLNQELDLQDSDGSSLSSDSDLSFDSDDGLSSDLSDSDDASNQEVTKTPKALKGTQQGPEFDFDMEEVTEVDMSVNYQALSDKERLLPLNMLVSDAVQTQILEQALKTSGRSVKDLGKVFDVNLLRFYNELIKANDPMVPYFDSYIKQRA